MTLTQLRRSFRPFEYQTIYEFYRKQKEAHWDWTDVPLSRDVTDWNLRLKDSEKKIIAGILNGFTQVETIIQDYWSINVRQWFPKPEVGLLCGAFSDMEATHQMAYSNLITTLGLEEFDAFQQEERVAAKLNNLINAPVHSDSLEDIALSLAIFSAFAEGVLLFSSFAVLRYLSIDSQLCTGKLEDNGSILQGLSTIIEYSQKDESLHSEAGCWLFNQLCLEYPELRTKELERKIIDAANISIQLEDGFIDQAFENDSLNGLNKEDLKEYIRMRTNTKLADLGYVGSELEGVYIPLIKYDKLKANNISSWFDIISTSTIKTDFFSNRETNYAQVSIDCSQFEFDF